MIICILKCVCICLLHVKSRWLVSTMKKKKMIGGGTLLYIYFYFFFPRPIFVRLTNLIRISSKSIDFELLFLQSIPIVVQKMKLLGGKLVLFVLPQKRKTFFHTKSKACTASLSLLVLSIHTLHRTGKLCC